MEYVRYGYIHYYIFAWSVSKHKCSRMQGEVCLDITTAIIATPTSAEYALFAPFSGGCDIKK